MLLVEKETDASAISFGYPIDKTSVEQVNAAVKKHLQDDNFHLVIITQDAAGLKQKLLAGQATSITYAGDRPAALLAEDKIIATLPLKVKDSDVTILPIDKVFQ